jgi:hypothetical protein
MSLNPPPHQDNDKIACKKGMKWGEKKSTMMPNPLVFSQPICKKWHIWD